MLKKRFNQYTILKHQKRTQAADMALMKQPESDSFYVPNRVTKALFKGCTGSLSGCNYYGNFLYGDTSYLLIKHKKILFTGSWAVPLGTLSGTSLNLSDLFPHICLLRLLFVAHARLITILLASKR